MKRKGIMLLFLMAIMAGAVFTNSTTAKAAIDNTANNLTYTYTDDINTYKDYVINDIAIDSDIFQSQDGLYLYKFTLEHDGYVKLLLSTGSVVKTSTRSGSSSYNVTTGETALTAAIYRDSMLLYSVAPAITAKGNAIKPIAVTSQKIALDQGTYYVAIQAEKVTNTYGGGTSTTNNVKGKAIFVVYYQPVESDEAYRPSSVGNENIISMEKAYKGLLTVPNPKDYYQFSVSDKSLVKINFRYSSTNNAKFVLYGTDREELISKAFSGSSIWYNVEKYLEPGTYYCSIESVTSNDGGQTELIINQTVYPLKLTQVNHSSNSYITVSTIDQPTEITYVKGKLTNSELNSSKWRSGKVITKDKYFGVNMTGYYTVRVTDEYGNMFMQSIQVTECDEIAPKKPTIKAFKAGTFVISGAAEKKSTVTVTVNGVAYSCTASSKGIYKCTLRAILYAGNMIEVASHDISGNISESTVAVVK